MPQFRIREASELLGSDDTVGRPVGRLAVVKVKVTTVSIETPGGSS